MFAAGKTASSGTQPDAQFNYVTMLLHGDGTNGAQNNTFLDSSTNNFTITRNGNTTQGSFSPYGSNWSNYLGTSNYLSFASNANLNLGSGDFTIECWFFHLTGTGNGIIWSQWNNGGGNDSQFLTNGTGLIYRIGANQWTFGTFVANNWTHVAVTRSGSTVRMFMNGVVARTETDSTNITTTGSTVIGANDTGATPANFFNGYISNFRQVKGTAVYTSNFTPSTTPLTAITNTQLLICQSNRFKDNSANNFTATIGGTPSVQRFNPFGASTAYSTSVIGGSGYFDAVNDTLATPTSTALNMRTGAFQIDFWMYPTASPGQFMGPFGTNNAGGNGGIFFANRSGNLDFTNNYDTAGVISTPYPRLNEWHHIALVRNSSNVRSFYLDGVRVGSLSNAVDFDQTQFIIGAYNASFGGWPGYVSNFRAIIGSNIADPTLSTITVPTTPNTAVANTQLLLDFTNGAIFDNAMMNDLETVGNAQISTSVKKYGTGSLAFDGTGDGLFARSTADMMFGTGDFTVEFWINLAANLSSFVKIVQMGTTGNCFTIETQSTTNVLNITNFTSTVYLASSTALTNSTWIHIAVTRASGTLRIFQNGTQTGSVANTVDFPNAGGLYIGQSSTGQAMNGYIDDLRITKGYARYTANFTPPTAAFSNTGPI